MSVQDLNVLFCCCYGSFTHRTPHTISTFSPPPFASTPYIHTNHLSVLLFLCSLSLCASSFVCSLHNIKKTPTHNVTQHQNRSANTELCISFVFVPYKIPNFSFHVAFLYSVLFLQLIYFQNASAYNMYYLFRFFSK